MRPRFTISEERWRAACEYAKATNRTPSELVCEALDQIEARYPKRPKINAEAEERIFLRIIAHLSPQVPAGTSGGRIDP